MYRKAVAPTGVTTSGRKSPAAGFTLLEVVIAVAIAGLALVGLFQAATGGLFAANTAGRVDEAIERAQSHLAAFSRSGAVTAGELEGDDGGGYHWRLSARPVATRQAADLGKSSPATILFDVEVEISWRTSGRSRSVLIETRRLGIGAAPE
jgi:general secretion pathway protein I